MAVSAISRLVVSARRSFFFSSFSCAWRVRSSHFSVRSSHFTFFQSLPSGPAGAAGAAGGAKVTTGCGAANRSVSAVQRQQRVLSRRLSAYPWRSLLRDLLRLHRNLRLAALRLRCAGLDSLRDGRRLLRLARRRKHGRGVGAVALQDGRAKWPDVTVHLWPQTAARVSPPRSALWWIFQVCVARAWSSVLCWWNFCPYSVRQRSDGDGAGSGSGSDGSISSAKKIAADRQQAARVSRQQRA